MKFEDFQFNKNGRCRRWEDLTKEEKDCLREQVYKQRKEEFERSWGFEKEDDTTKEE